MKEFLKEYSSGKVGFVRNALAHVEKSCLVLAQSDVWSCWLFCDFYLLRTRLLSGVIKHLPLWFVGYGITRFVLVKYSCAFVKRLSQGTSSLVSRLTTVSLDTPQQLVVILWWQKV